MVNIDCLLNYLRRWCRDWKPRRLVITKNIIAFSLTDDTTMIDQIPLHEVQAVQDMDPNFDKEIKDTKQKQNIKNGKINMHDMEESIQFANSIQISTKHDGFNSGRAYCLRSDSESQSRELANTISRLANAAKER